MVKLVFFLHLLFAIFAIGPLVHAATTAARGLRTGDSGAAAASARVLRIYAYASVLVVIAGMGLMSMDDPDHKGTKIGEFSQPWIWVSLLLWLAAVAIVLAVLVPALTRAGHVTAGTDPGGATAGQAAVGRVAASGGIVALLFAAIVALMVYQPGH